MPLDAPRRSRRHNLFLPSPQSFLSLAATASGIVAIDTAVQQVMHAGASYSDRFSPSPHLSTDVLSACRMVCAAPPQLEPLKNLLESSPQRILDDGRTILPVLMDLCDGTRGSFMMMKMTQLNLLWKAINLIVASPSTPEDVVTTGMRFVWEQFKWSLFSHDWTDSKWTRYAIFIASHLVACVRSWPYLLLRSDACIDVAELMQVYSALLLTLAGSDFPETTLLPMHDGVVARLDGIFCILGGAAVSGTQPEETSSCANARPDLSAHSPRGDAMGTVQHLLQLLLDSSVMTNVRAASSFAPLVTDMALATSSMNATLQVARGVTQDSTDLRILQMMSLVLLGWAPGVCNVWRCRPEHSTDERQLQYAIHQCDTGCSTTVVESNALDGLLARIEQLSEQLPASAWRLASEVDALPTSAPSLGDLWTRCTSHALSMLFLGAASHGAAAYPREAVLHFLSALSSSSSDGVSLLLGAWASALAASPEKGAAAPGGPSAHLHYVAGAAGAVLRHTRTLSPGMARWASSVALTLALGCAASGLPTPSCVLTIPIGMESAHMTDAPGTSGEWVESITAVADLFYSGITVHDMWEGRGSSVDDCVDAALYTARVEKHIQQVVELGQAVLSSGATDIRTSAALLGALTRLPSMLQGFRQAYGTSCSSLADYLRGDWQCMSSLLTGLLEQLCSSPHISGEIGQVSRLSSAFLLCQTAVLLEVAGITECVEPNLLALVRRWVKLSFASHENASVAQPGLPCVTEAYTESSAARCFLMLATHSTALSLPALQLSPRVAKYLHQLLEACGVPSEDGTDEMTCSGAHEARLMSSSLRDRERWRSTGSLQWGADIGRELPTTPEMAHAPRMLPLVEIQSKLRHSHSLIATIVAEASTLPNSLTQSGDEHALSGMKRPRMDSYSFWTAEERNQLIATLQDLIHSGEDALRCLGAEQRSPLHADAHRKGLALHPHVTGATPTCSPPAAAATEVIQVD